MEFTNAFHSDCPTAPGIDAYLYIWERERTREIYLERNAVTEDRRLQRKKAIDVTFPSK